MHKQSGYWFKKQGQQAGDNNRAQPSFLRRWTDYDSGTFKLRDCPGHRCPPEQQLQAGNGARNRNRRSVALCAAARWRQGDTAIAPADGRQAGTQLQAVELSADVLGWSLALGPMVTA